MRFITISAAFLAGLLLARSNHHPKVENVDPQPLTPIVYPVPHPVAPVVPQTPAIVWRDYDVGMQEAATSNKTTFVYVRSNTCVWCDRLEKEFADQQLIAIVAAGYIPIKVVAENRPDLVTGLQIKSFPTLASYNSDRTGRWSSPGFRSASKIRDLLAPQKSVSVIAEPAQLPFQPQQMRASWGVMAPSAGNCRS